MENVVEMMVGPEEEGLRLDRVLEGLVPEGGLRLRRRLCDQGRVLVNGRPAKSSCKVREGQTVQVRMERVACDPADMGLRVLCRRNGLAAVDKPAGVHSAVVAGSSEPSVEGALPRLFPGENAVLLNRLDQLTSGIVLVALTAEAEARYHEAESARTVTKEYLARVAGRLDSPVTVRFALDTDNRRLTRVLDKDDPDSRRWTRVEPLNWDEKTQTSLVRCFIRMGARHQIRVHLAALGHPILGDPLYGGPEAERLHLHHRHFVLGDFSAQSEMVF